MEFLSLLFHPGQSRVVVRELVQVCERDLASQHRVIVSYIGSRINRTMLELNVEAHSELLDIKLAPVYTKCFADPFGFFGNKTPGLCHRALLSLRECLKILKSIRKYAFIILHTFAGPVHP